MTTYTNKFSNYVTTNKHEAETFVSLCMLNDHCQKSLKLELQQNIFFTFVKEENMISTSVRFYCSLCPFWENFDSLFRWSPGQDTIGRTIIKYMHINGFLYMLQLFKNIFLFYLFMDFIFFRKIYHL